MLLHLLAGGEGGEPAPSAIASDAACLGGVSWCLDARSGNVNPLI